MAIKRQSYLSRQGIIPILNEKTFNDFTGLNTVEAGYKQMLLLSEYGTGKVLNSDVSVIQVSGIGILTVCDKINFPKNVFNSER